VAEVCRNCAAPLDGPYCARCGQRDLPLREPFWSVLGRFAGEQLVLDSRMGRTVRPFLTRPGFLTREHNAGRRARYSDPLRLYVLMSLLLFLGIGVRALFSSADGSPSTTNVVVDSGVGDTLTRWFGEDSRITRGWKRKHERFGELSPEERTALLADTALAKIPTAMLLLLPAFALLLRLGMAGTGWLYAQHFVFVLHVHAFYYLVFLVPVLVPHPLAALFVALAIPAYYLLALRGAYGERGLSLVLRALVMAPFYLALLIVAMIGLLLLSVLAA
jgi:hypothetical protein